MKNKVIIILLSMVLLNCSEPNKPILNTGMWRAELMVMDNEILPFNFALFKSGTDNYTMEIYNSEETIFIDEISVLNDSITIKTPVYEGYLIGKFTENFIKGNFIKESLDRTVPFIATFDKTERFETTTAPTEVVSGIWETVINPETDDAYIAKGVFEQNGKIVTGTFETTTGDYRYLDGVVNGDSLKISTFDGAHAFLFTAKLSDSVMNGVFYSGNHSKEPFTAKRNPTYALPSTDSLTFIKEGYEKFDFAFPDEKGNIVSLRDARFENKVVIVQIMGSWCPNCLDETKFYTTYLKENPSSELEIVALAFEYARTSEKALKSIKRFTDRLGVEYPVLLAQYGTSDKEEAQQKLPMLNHVLSYPTTIFIDKKGAVRKIHTGFNGPATGRKYTDFKKEFSAFVTELIQE